MHLTSSEQALWEEHLDFFSPKGIDNDAAFTAYLSKYVAAPQEFGQQEGYSQQMLLGAILKQAPDHAFSMAFGHYYKKLRAGSNSVEFDAWLGEVAAERPLLLVRALREAAPTLDFTEQIMILRDAQRWFPQENIKTFAAPKLLKTKPTVVMKQFNPVLGDMPPLLDMAVALMALDDAQCNALGDTIARGCFIARYGMAVETDPEGFPDTGQIKPSEKYSTPAAFSMVFRHGIDMQASTLIEQVQLRYKAQSVTFDALAYPVLVLESQDSTPQERAFAQSVVDTVLSVTEKDANWSQMNVRVVSALSRIHAALDDFAMMLRIEEHIHTRLFADPTHMSGLDKMLSCVQENNLPLRDALVQRTVDRVPDNQKLAFYLEALFFRQSSTSDLDLCIAVSFCNDAFFATIPAQSIEPFVMHSLQHIFHPNPVLQEHAQIKPQNRIGELLGVMRKWTALAWSPEQTRAFVDSPLAATTILLYLYMAAAGHRSHAEPTHSQGVPYVHWEPLPLLQKLYPNKAPLWNQMKLGLLQMPQAQTEEGKKYQYEQVMASMFKVFSAAFLPDGPSFETTHGIVDSLGVNPLDYFMEAQKNTAPNVAFDLPDDMFAPF